MAAYMIVMLALGEDSDWRTAYGRDVPSIIESYGGEYCMRSGGREVVALEGVDNPPGRVALIRFPSLDAARAFIDAPEYRPYRDARMAAAETTILAFEADD